MKINIRGVRGSIPTSGPDTVIYGGNTSCTDIEKDGWHLILDGGSGMRNSQTGNRPFNNRVDILLTHLHLDHIQGLGFFKPLFDPGMEVHIWGPASSAQTLHSRLARYLSPPLFPVHIRDLPCKIQLHEVDFSKFDIGPFTIRTRYVIHPGPTVGFRITDHKSVFTYIPDHEPALGLHGIPQNRKWVSGIDLAEEADVLLHDAQYTAEEYKTRKGWGHSSIEDAAKFSSVAGVKSLLLAHHDPYHADSFLENMLCTFKAASDYTFKIELAAEGMKFEI